MTGNLNAKWSDFPAALTVGAQVLLIDADPLSLSELARVLAPVVDLAVTNSADSALESIEAGALVARAARRRLALLDGLQPVSRGLRACGGELNWLRSSTGSGACNELHHDSRIAAHFRRRQEAGAESLFSVSETAKQILL